MSKFFNSLWFKCITVLLVISVAFGGLLAIANDVLYVSPEERASRAIIKIYGEEKQFETIIDKDTLANQISYDDIGSVNKLFVVGNADDSSFDYLFQTTGTQGYKGGSITLWVQVSVNEGRMAINKIVQESYEKQTLMSKITNAFYSNFQEDIDGIYYTSSSNSENQKTNIVSGATYSAQAACNAVNCVIRFLTNDLGGI